MAKPKPVTKKGSSSKSRKPATVPSRGSLHRKRGWWFGVLISGLVIIQFAYNLHSIGRPQILGYATSISTETLLQDTNDYRARDNLPPLKLNGELDRAAQIKAETMVAQNYWNHVAPDGTTPWSYFRKVNYNYSNAGENLAYGFTTSDQVVTAWMNSYDHRQNVLGNYNDVGFGYANGAHYRGGNNTVVVAFYGLPAGAKPSMTTGQSSGQSLGATAPITNAAQTPQHISGMTAIAAGSAPWATYASLALIGATFLGFLITHLEALRMGWQNAKRYALLHPLIDAAVIVALTLIVLQAAGGFIR
jgi:Cysteine-rich secretory protein family